MLQRLAEAPPRLAQPGPRAAGWLAVWQLPLIAGLIAGGLARRQRRTGRQPHTPAVPRGDLGRFLLKKHNLGQKEKRYPRRKSGPRQFAGASRQEDGLEPGGKTSGWQTVLLRHAVIFRKVRCEMAWLLQKQSLSLLDMAS